VCPHDPSAWVVLSETVSRRPMSWGNPHATGAIRYDVLVIT